MGSDESEGVWWSLVESEGVSGGSCRHDSDGTRLCINLCATPLKLDVIGGWLAERHADCA